ncbi:hypothetical protein GCM10009798_23660 [Nocardioides panacihumi]|uniref:Glycosyltransferase n=1 Tax=Nocardioides panacihumi TaxID=400774 RepID=A0ABP5CF92_9ACTN
MAGIVGRAARRLRSQRPSAAERLLLESPLFDADWYAAQAGRPLRGTAAVRHYLAEGVARGLQPHPLFDPTFVRSQWTQSRLSRLGDGDPLTFYLRRQAYGTATHPLFDAAGYVLRTPEAATHPGGPTAHYVQVGAAAGLPANDWLAGDLTAWLVARRQEAVRRRGAAAVETDAGDLNDGVAWDELAGREQDDAVVSVIIPTYDDFVMTFAAVDAVVASDGVDGVGIDCLVWDNGSRPEVAAALDALPLRSGAVRLLRSETNLGFALGNNLALPHARGSVVVFLNNDTTVPPGWLPPLVEALRDTEVLGVQPLLVYPTGAVQSAGVAFPTTGGLPHQLLQGFPAEDAAGIAGQRLHALTGAALTIRYSDAVALRGFDPGYVNGMEDVDLCRRLAELRPGHFRVLPEQPVVHHESRTPGRYARYLANRELYLERWHGRDEPRDDGALWASAGYRVMGHEVRRRNPKQERRLLVPEPVLVHELRFRADPRPLRWAIKNPALSGAAGDSWGDTHFADSLAVALRRLGEDVVIDRRGEFERATSRHDDVALLLRGRLPLRPTPEQVTIAWVISHPDRVTLEEVRQYDRVVAASTCWAAERSHEWGVRIDPLLQATDPERFHPDAAVPDTGERLVFIGSTDGRVRAVVHDAIEAGLDVAVHGSGWDGLLPPDVHRSSYVDNSELAAAYRRAGIVLNDHWTDMRREGFVSNRLFDAVASGARVVTDEIDGLDELFGDSVQVYRSVDDLRRLASLPDPDAVFGDDAARRLLAAKVRREHSFDARAKDLVAIAHELHAGR